MTGDDSCMLTFTLSLVIVASIAALHRRPRNFGEGRSILDAAVTQLAPRSRPARVTRVAIVICVVKASAHRVLGLTAQTLFLVPELVTVATIAHQRS